jgi:hypothetical protein
MIHWEVILFIFMYFKQQVVGVDLNLIQAVEVEEGLN